MGFTYLEQMVGPGVAVLDMVVLVHIDFRAQERGGPEKSTRLSCKSSICETEPNRSVSLPLSVWRIEHEQCGDPRQPEM